MLCISGNLDSEINTYIRTGDQVEIQGSTELKLLGFWYGRRPNVDVHVEKIAAKFRTRLWALRHLRQSGMGESDLLKIYLTVLRPVLDFAAATYHPILTKQQSDLLEALQKRASKIIFGFDSSYANLVGEGKLELLADRRRQICTNFAAKAATNEIFSSRWFPRREKPEHHLRHPQMYVEGRVRTERMRKNPVSYMRKELNALNNPS